MGVERTHVQRFPQNRDTAIVPSATDAEVVWKRVVVAPERPAGDRVHRDDVARRFGDEHDAVDDQRRRFRSVELWDVVGPLQLEIPDSVDVDLVENIS